MANYIIHGKKWRDKVNGNTYNSVRVYDSSGTFVVALPYEYGYGQQYFSRAMDYLHLERGDRESVCVYDVCETGCTKREVKEWGESKHG